MVVYKADGRQADTLICIFTHARMCVCILEKGWLPVCRLPPSLSPFNFQFPRQYHAYIKSMSSHFRNHFVTTTVRRRSVITLFKYLSS